MRVGPTSPGKATYVVSTADWQWLRNEQRKLHLRSWEEPSYVFRKLWGLITDPRNLRCALARVARNRGRRSPGVDKVTVGKILSGNVDGFVAELRTQLRSRSFRPSPVRRVMIPKPGKPGKFRPLGIPTVTDRVVQAAMKNIMEPIFEADFYPNSYGFRPGQDEAPMQRWSIFGCSSCPSPRTCRKRIDPACSKLLSKATFGGVSTTSAIMV